MTMKLSKLLLTACVLCFTSIGLSQADPDPSNNEPCPNDLFPCCQTWNACNGPYYGSWSYDPDFPDDGFCDLSCTPIDSGVLFLLLGGAAFGGAMIARNRRRELQLKSERV